MTVTKLLKPSFSEKNIFSSIKNGGMGSQSGSPKSGTAYRDRVAILDCLKRKTQIEEAQQLLNNLMGTGEPEHTDTKTSGKKSEIRRT